MNIYQVSTGCYSDFTHQILVHEKFYSKDEFSSLCKEICERIPKKDDYWANEDEVVDLLIKNYGFQRPRVIGCHFWDYSAQKGEEDEQFQGSDSSENENE